MLRVLILVIFLLVAGCDKDTFVCGEDHAAVARARSLSLEQLEELYTYAYEFYSSLEEQAYLEDPETGPEAIEILKPIQISKNRCRTSVDVCIKLAGCMDEYIFLSFYGVADDSRIELEWAEGPYEIGSQVLWRKDG